MRMKRCSAALVRVELVKAVLAAAVLAAAVLAAAVLVAAVLAGGAAGGTAAQAAMLPWHQVSAGRAFTCAIQDERTLWCWGANGFGQLGIGSTSGSFVPAQVGTRANWSQVSAGLEHACAIFGSGTLWCWGSNLDGELGINNVGITQADSPLKVGGTGWAQVAAGGDHTCAIRTDHTLWCWGANGRGQLGVGSKANKSKPVQVGTQAVWARVSTGSETTCAIRLDGTLWCWGLNLFGQIGDGTFTSELLPVQVGTSTWSQVSVGDVHTCAVRADFTLWCWGGNYNDQLGISPGPNREPSPVRVGLSSTWRDVTAGGHHTCALHGDPALWCWGDNEVGELGIGTSGGNLRKPTRVGTQTYWRQASAGEGHTCAIRRDFTLWCWGDNGDGELGIGATPTQENSPVQVG